MTWSRVKPGQVCRHPLSAQVLLGVINTLCVVEIKCLACDGVCIARLGSKRVWRKKEEL